jgi:outer membrane protein assembly factor BamB
MAGSLVNATARSGVMLAAVVALLSGCSTIESWNPFSGDSKAKNPPAKLEDFKSTMAVRTVWELSAGDSDKFLFSPALVDDGVYVAAANGNVTRIDAASGRQSWRIDAGMHLTAGVGADKNLVVVVGEKGVVQAFSTDGKKRWTAQSSSEVLSAPAVGSGVVIVRSLDNRISAFDAETGNRKWSIQRTVPPLILRNAPGIAIDKTFAYIALPGGRLIAVSINTGAIQWEATVGEARGATELERIADAAGAPVISGTDVCAVAYQGKVACYNMANGTARWSKDLSSYVGIGLDERFVFAADASGNVSALTRDNGVSVWRSTKLANRRLSTPYSYGRAVVVGDFEGYIHFLSREDGSFLARVKFDKGALQSAPVLAGANLIFQTQSGTVVALAAE